MPAAMNRFLGFDFQSDWLILIPFVKSDCFLVLSFQSHWLMFLVLALLGQLLFDTAQHVTSVTFILVLDSIKSLTVYRHSAFELIEYYYTCQFFLLINCFLVFNFETQWLWSYCFNFLSQSLVTCVPLRDWYVVC